MDSSDVLRCKFRKIDMKECLQIVSFLWYRNFLRVICGSNNSFFIPEILFSDGRQIFTAIQCYISLKKFLGLKMFVDGLVHGLYVQNYGKENLFLFTGFSLSRYCKLFFFTLPGSYILYHNVAQLLAQNLLPVKVNFCFRHYFLI